MKCLIFFFKLFLAILKDLFMFQFYGNHINSREVKNNRKKTYNIFIFIKFFLLLFNFLIDIYFIIKNAILLNNHLLNIMF